MEDRTVVTHAAAERGKSQYLGWKGRTNFKA